MRRRQSSPALMRYFMARLRPLGRPIFWGPAIALLLLVLFTWDFWTSPGLQSSLGIGDSDPEEVTQEDQAIGADIDSMPVLLNDIGIAAKTTAPKPQQSPLLQKSNTEGSAITSFAPSSAPQPSPANAQGAFGVFNNALAERYGLTNSGTVVEEQPAAIVPGTIGLGAMGASNPAPAAPAQSPLQAAMSKIATQAQPGVGSPAINGLAAPPNLANPPAEGSAPLSSPGIDGMRGTTAPVNSYTNLMGGSQPLQDYSTVPAPVPAPVPAMPNLSPAPIPSSFGQPSAPQPGNFGVQSPAPAINQQPFSVPRPIPGRTIGGGKINTFSNP